MIVPVVIAVMTGLQRDLQSKILGSTPHVYVFEESMGFRLGDWQRVLETVRGTPGVVYFGHCAPADGASAAKIARARGRGR